MQEKKLIYVLFPNEFALGIPNRTKKGYGMDKKIAKRIWQ